MVPLSSQRCQFVLGRHTNRFCDAISCLFNVVDLLFGKGLRLMKNTEKENQTSRVQHRFDRVEIVWHCMESNPFPFFFLYQDISGPSKQGATHLEQTDANLFLGGTFQLSSDQDPTLFQLNLARSDLSIHFSRPLARPGRITHNCCSRLLHN